MDESTKNEFYDTIKFAKLDKLRNILKVRKDSIRNTDLLDVGLLKATLYGKYNIVKELLDHGANVDATDTLGDSSVHVATRNNDLKLVQLFIQYRCNFNQQNFRGTTALMIAAQQGYLEIMSLLCLMGADLNLKQKDGYTVLLFAVLSKNSKTFEDLMRIYKKHNPKLDINATEKNGQTALMLAANNGNFEIVKMLCDQGAEVNIQNRISGQTALHFGAINNDTQVVEALIAAGACLNVINKNYHTPLYYAKDPTKKILIKAGAYETHNTHIDIPLTPGKISLHTEASKVIDSHTVYYELPVSSNHHQESNIAAQLSYTIEENFQWDEDTLTHDAVTEQSDDQNIKANVEKRRMSKKLIEHIYKLTRRFMEKNSINGTKTSSSNSVINNTFFDEKVIISVKACGNLVIGNKNTINVKPDHKRSGARSNNVHINDAIQ